MVFLWEHMVMALWLLVLMLASVAALSVATVVCAIERFAPSRNDEDDRATLVALTAATTI
jgi:hypothetical protein